MFLIQKNTDYFHNLTKTLFFLSLKGLNRTPVLLNDERYRLNFKEHFKTTFDLKFL